MGLRRLINLSRTDEKRYGTFRSLDICELNTEVIETFMVPDDRWKYKMTLALGVAFHANQAQLESAKENARRHLMSALYGDAMDGLRQIKRAIYAGDADEAIKCLDALAGYLLEDSRND